MAIQFQCVSCEKAIEVADEWSCRLVECPYCGDTITAPGMSHPIQQASPLDLPDRDQSTLDAASSDLAPTMRGGLPNDRADEISGGAAGLATSKPQNRKRLDVLALIGLVLGILAMGLLTACIYTVYEQIMEPLGAEVTPEAIKKLLDKAMENQEPWLVGLSMKSLAGMACWLGGFIVSLVAVVQNRQNPRGNLAYIALAICSAPLLLVALSLACQPS